MTERKQLKIIFAVTNDLNQDQRMHRICTTLHEAGYDIQLIGRRKSGSAPLYPQKFMQKRIYCLFQKGVLFYAEYNIRLFCFLLFQSFDSVCSIDYDTLPACTSVSQLKSKKLVFDAHEFFTEVPELTGRPLVKKIWTYIGNICIPKSHLSYTVNESLADIFTGLHGKHFHYVYNAPEWTEQKTITPHPKDRKWVLLYQGMLNEGRCLASLIRAMEYLPECELQLAGEGDLSDSLRSYTANLNYSGRIKFIGWQTPESLKKITGEADLGINLLAGNSLNNYYSLANKFFDYLHAAVPSVNMNFPEYRNIVSKYNIGILLESAEPDYVAAQIRTLILHPAEYQKMQKNCLLASKEFNWQHESEKLLNLFRELFTS
jgi:glycosyltransferase involved in cell wall biosynthesis